MASWAGQSIQAQEKNMPMEAGKKEKRGMFGLVDKSWDTRLTKMVKKVAPQFKVLKFKDEVTGRTMTYNLFIPKHQKKNQKYPLVLFMGDATTVSKDPMTPLKQGYGGIIWATEESQKEHPAFVLVPVFEGPQSVTNDRSEVSEEGEIALRLLHHVTEQYAVDTDRIYTTGQSMGGMLSMCYNIQHPDLFAGSLFVSCQWDIHAMTPLAKKKFFYVISAADPKASIGMNELSALLKEQNTSFGEVEFSAKLPEKTQSQKVQTLLKQGHTINFVRFTPGTVLPEGKTDRMGEHMYAFDHAYLIKSVRDWLFQQKK